MYKLYIIKIMFSFLILSLCLNPIELMAKTKALKTKNHSGKMYNSSVSKHKFKAKITKNKNKSKSKRHRKSNGPDLKALTTVSPGTEFAETPSNGVNSIEIKSDL